MSEVRVPVPVPLQRASYARRLEALPFSTPEEFAAFRAVVCHGCTRDALYQAAVTHSRDLHGAGAAVDPDDDRDQPGCPHLAAAVALEPVPVWRVRKRDGAWYCLAHLTRREARGHDPHPAGCGSCLLLTPRVRRGTATPGQISLFDFDEE